MKKNTARKYAKTGLYPNTFSAVWDSIPDTLIKTLTAKELAQMVDLLRHAYVLGHNEGWYEGIDKTPEQLAKEHSLNQDPTNLNNTTINNKE